MSDNLRSSTLGAVRERHRGSYGKAGQAPPGGCLPVLDKDKPGGTAGQWADSGGLMTSRGR